MGSNGTYHIAPLRPLLPKENRLQWGIAFVVFAAGMCYMPLRMMGFDLASIPGDLGDSRFNLYILEHGYQYLTGRVQHYWDAPMMYPTANVIARSDNLLGTMPIYAAFRGAGLSSYSALQGWLLALNALNFAACFYVLQRRFGLPLLAAVGAYIFAFGLFNIGQSWHFQVFPRFVLPLIFYWGLRYLEEPRAGLLLALVLGIVFQFYCGIYLGFFALFMLLCLLLAHLAVRRGFTVLRQFADRRTLIYALGTVVLGAVLLYPLMAPYVDMGKSVGMRSFTEVADSIPRVRSYFFAYPASWLWSPLLFAHSHFAFEQWWLHFLFPGAIPWLGVAGAVVLLRARWPEPSGKRGLQVLLLAFALSMAFTLRFGDYTLYKAVYSLPGFSSMRAVVRVVNIQVLFFVFIMCAALWWCWHRTGRWRMLLYALPVLTFADQAYVMTREVYRFRKSDAVDRETLVREALSAYDPAAFDAVLVALPEAIKDDHNAVIHHHLTAMLACQALGITCVNAYTGSYPEGYMPLFDRTDEETLLHWCRVNGVERERVVRVAGGESLVTGR